MFFLTIASTILFAFGVQKMWFMPIPKGIRVLMYHKISVHEKSDLTITCEQLDSHLNYLQKNDYQFITTQQVIDFYVHQKTLPPNPILLTFDDGYENVFQDAYPILKKYDAKATLFITTAFVGGINAWDRGNDKITTLEQLKKLDTAIFELGLHSHHHQNYKQLSLQQIENDLQTNIDFFKNNHLNYTPAFAYPYGGCPKNAAPAFKKWGIQMAFRIGNKVNHFKTNDLYALKRIDVKGTDDFDTFKLKVKKGRTKLIL
jgi:peptidoglycan/xylan/chitin deacetylase (PgdA/CDA1 family)